MKERILEQIRQASTIEEISETDELVNIGIDSLEKIDLIIQLEDALEVRFDESDLDPSELRTVEDIIMLVEKYLQKKEGSR